MKNLFYIILPICLMACVSTAHVSHIDAPALDHTTYKTTAGKNKFFCIYYYTSGSATENGDMIMKAIMKRMEGKAEFYICDLQSFPQHEVMYVEKNIIGSNVLPSYIFYRDNRIVLKVSIKNTHTVDQAKTLALKLFNEFQERNWYQPKEHRKDR